MQSPFRSSSQDKNISTILLASLLLLLLAACVPLAQNPQGAAPNATQDIAASPATPALSKNIALSENIKDGCVEAFDPNLDYFPEKVTVDVTQGFQVAYFNHYKVVTINTPFPDAAEAIRYALVQCGTPAPDGFSPEQIFEVPAKSIVTMSTTYLPYLDQLGLLDKLVGIDEATYINNASVLKMVEAGQVKAIGSGVTVNVEQALDLQPDLIMTYASGAPDYDAHPKLIEAGLKVVLNAEWLDGTPLGRAEWGKFIALFFNRETSAQQNFAATAQRYNDFKALAANSKNKPSVLVGTPYQGVWYLPGGMSFGAVFLADAGATYPWNNDPSTGSLALSIEDVFDKSQAADVWINIGFYPSLADMLAADERFAEFSAFQKGAVWNNDQRQNVNGGNDYYESGVANPDVVLADLIKILHPEALPEHEFVYYHQVK
jgi:iron complex transport system substrate-binding protein